MPLFSIITPTLQRGSLIRCCESVNNQTFQDWEHLIAVDSDIFDYSLLELCVHPQRRFILCGRNFGHFGNHARWMAWEKTVGRYLVMLDDDNTMYRENALADAALALQLDNFPDWALFPIHRHGAKFLLLPPGMCRTDSANIVVKREIGRWPDIEMREADGYFAEHLANNFAYSGFPDIEPIILMEKSSNGI